MAKGKVMIKKYNGKKILVQGKVRIKVIFQEEITLEAQLIQIHTYDRTYDDTHKSIMKDLICG